MKRNRRPYNPTSRLRAVAFHFVWLLVLFFVLTACNTLHLSPMPQAREGLLELGAWDLAQDGSVKLNGQWEFYWNRLLEPADFQRSDDHPKPTGFLDLPRYWNGTDAEGGRPTGDGFATFRLRIITDDAMVPRLQL